MKVKISLELDLSDTSYNIKDESELTGSLQNLSDLFADIERNVLEKKLRMYSATIDDITREMLNKHYDDDLKVAKTAFDNWKVEGRMEDGKTFSFSHSKPYIEETLIDGKLKVE